jgi:uncharacterized membrane protein YjfL (UPF0719 family)
VGVAIEPGAASGHTATGHWRNARGALKLFAQALLVAVGLVLSLVVIAFSLWLFTRLTGDLDEWGEIGKGKVGVAALLTGVILATALLSGAALDSVLKLFFH